jgi:hypothetical protein
MWGGKSVYCKGGKTVYLDPNKANILTAGMVKVLDFSNPHHHGY